LKTENKIKVRYNFKWKTEKNSQNQFSPKNSTFEKYLGSRAAIPVILYDSYAGSKTILSRGEETKILPGK
jgi:hypothetical protein